MLSLIRSPWITRVASVAVLFVSGRVSSAATLSVSSLADDGSAGTLRSQIAAAAPDDTLVFDVAGTITLNGTKLLLDKNLSIQGPADGSVTISADKKSRVLEVGSGAKVSLSKLSLINGLTYPNNGAGILNAGTLDLDGVTLSGHFGARGAGIWSTGTLSISNSTFSSNQAFNEGGAIWTSGTLTLKDSSLSANTASGGAGIYNSGSLANLTVSGCKMSANRAYYHRNGDTQSGGGILNEGLLQLSTSYLSENKAEGGSGGGLFNSPTGNATVNQCAFSSGSAGYYGAGACNRGTMTVTNSTVCQNLAISAGGGYYNAQNATLSLVSNTLYHNGTQTGYPGNICNDGNLTIGNNILDDPFRNIGGYNSFDGGLVTSTGYNFSAGWGWDIRYLNNPRDRFGFGFSYDLKFDTAGLKDNGGPTPTIALMPGSPLIDVGNATGVDQRGVARPFNFASINNAVEGNGSDVGAFEAQAGPAAKFEVTATPNPAQTGETLSVTFRVLDAVGYPAEDYRGTVRFSSTDEAASLPGDYTFTASDVGTHTFALNLKTLGSQTITVGDDVLGQSKTLSITVAEKPSLQVNTLEDVLSNTDGKISLRDAVAYANTLTGTPIVTFDPALFDTPKTLLLSNYTSLAHNMVIQGPGANLLTIDAKRKTDLFGIRENVSATISGLTLTGAIKCAIFNSGTVTVASCAIVNNGGPYSDIATFYNNFSYPTKATIIDSTFSGNTSSSSASSVGDMGSAIFNGGELAVTNCTFTGNKGASTIAIHRTSTTTLNNCTLSGNTSSGTGTATIAFTPAYFTYTSSVGNGLTLNNSIVAGNTGTEINSTSTVKGDYNVLGAVGAVSFAGTNNKVGVTDLGIETLRNNGGATETLALLPNSPAVNAGAPAFDATGTANDQRGAGFSRVRSGRLDSGAFELQNLAPRINSLTLAPQQAKTNDTLSSTISVLDDDGDTFTTSYAWKKNGQTIPNESESTLDLSKPGNGDKDDKIWVVATVSDGQGATSSLASAPVTIGNSAPTLESFEVAPSSPTTNATLSLAAPLPVKDADGDELTTTYQWKKNGIALQGQTEKTLSLSGEGHGDRDDTLSLSVVVNDGTDSVSGESKGVVVVNSVPQLTQVAIDNQNPTTNALLTATAFRTDADHDSLALSYVWKKNGVVVENATAETLDLSKAGNGDEGDKISVVVTADDGHEGRVSLESRPVTIRPFDAPSLALSQNSLKENLAVGVVVGTLSTSGRDSGNTFTYTLVGGEGSEDNSAFQIRGNVLYALVTFNYEQKSGYSVRVKSTDENGLATETAFTINVINANDQPSVKVSISPSPATTNAVLRANAVGSDEDGDPVSFTYQWQIDGSDIRDQTGPTFDLRTLGAPYDGHTMSVVVWPYDGRLTGLAAKASTKIVNSPPVMQGTTFNGTENIPLSAQIAATDVDIAAGQELRYEISSSPRYGTLSYKVKDNVFTFTYTPKPNWNGTDSFRLVAKDLGTAVAANFTLKIAPINNVPTAKDDAIKGVEDVALSIAAPLLLRNDTNGETPGEVDALKIVKVAVPAGFPGSLKLDVTKQTILFTPKPNWNGTTVFTYTVQDSGRATATAQVTLQIAPVNDAPIALPSRMTVLSGTVGELALAGTDVEGDVLTFGLSTKPTNGAVGLFKVVDKWIARYQSKVGFTGIDTFSVIARDGKVNSTPATITVTVTPNSAPQLVSLLPSRGSFAAGSTVVFEQKVRDVNGTAHLDASALLIGNLPTAANARGGATFWFDAVENRFTLTKDDGVNSLAPVALGSTLENSQVKVTLGADDVVRDRYGVLTLRWRVTFKPAFVGTKSLWMRVEDLGELSAGFTKSGDITLTPVAKQAPVSPSAGTS